MQRCSNKGSSRVSNLLYYIPTLAGFG